MCPGIQGPRERTEWRDNPYLWIIPANLDHNKFHSWIIPATCVVHGSKSEKRWVVNPTILLRWDQVVNQVVNKRLMLKQMQMCPGIQEPRERTKWWRDNPYLWIVPADIDLSKFYSWIVPANEGSKEEGGKENMLVSVTISTYAYLIWTDPTFSFQTLDIITTSLWHHSHTYDIIYSTMTSFTYLWHHY